MTEEDEGHLCSVCGRPVMWGSRHRPCGEAVMVVERERDEARARLVRLESAVRVLGDELYTLQDGLVWLREEANKDVSAASAAICSVVSMVNREGPKGLPGAAPNK